MLNLGWVEVSLIILVAVLIFGPKRLPALGGAIGKAVRGIKEGLQEGSTSDPSDKM
jgi:sec-independent protein translocase protein TatA